MAKNKGGSSEGDNKLHKPKLTTKKDKQREHLTYQQTPLHAIDHAPEPKSGSKIDRHAVSAADILNQSLNNLDSSSHHHRRGSSKDNIHSSSGGNAANHKNASFILQGSATSLLTNNKGPGAATAVTVRRRSYSDTNASNVAAVMAAAGGGGSVTTSPKSDTDGMKNTRGPSIFAPKEIQQRVRVALGDLDASSGDEEMGGESGTGVVAAGAAAPAMETSDGSDDSYDADILGTGLDAGVSESEDAFDESGRADMMNRQVSNLSGGKGLTGSVADLSIYSDDYDDDDEFAGSISTEEEYDGPMSCCGIRACRVRRCIKGNRIASAIVRYAPCFWCFPIPVSATDRTILTRLNIISAFFSIGQVVATAWLVIVLLIPPNAARTQDDKYTLTHGMQPNLWSLTGSMYSIGFFGTSPACLLACLA